MVHLKSVLDNVLIRLLLLMLILLSGRYCRLILCLKYVLKKVLFTRDIASLNLSPVKMRAQGMLFFSERRTFLFLSFSHFHQHLYESFFANLS